MLSRCPKPWISALLGGIGLVAAARGQESTPPPPSQAPATLPVTPQGVEVLARGPVHEAFAAPTTEPAPTRPVPKQPPAPIDELPPEQKPDGDVVWIGGYWAWDDDRRDFLWVSGIWRALPPGKHWIAGYWRQDAGQWFWVPGFWAAAPEATQQQVTYLPAPPAAPEVAPPADPPTAESFYVPGYWVWDGWHYAWRAGYWAQVQPGYVWVPAHYRWTPTGYIFIPGYWDLAVARRGVLFAPVVVDAAIVGPTFVYTPTYVVRDNIVLDTLFVRPCYCHYYFGDYYGPTYRELGFESCIVYSRRNYDAIFVYSRWEHRTDPGWATLQLDVCLARHAGQAPRPPRTLAQQTVVVQNVTNNVTNVTNVQTTVVNNNTVLLPATQMAAVTRAPVVPLNNAARYAVKRQAQAVQQVAVQRSRTEIRMPGGAPAQPRVASYTVPPPPRGATHPFIPTPKLTGVPGRSMAPVLPYSSSAPQPMLGAPNLHAPVPYKPGTPYPPGPGNPYGRPPGYPNQLRPNPPPAHPAPPKPQNQQNQQNRPPANGQPGSP